MESQHLCDRRIANFQMGSPVFVVRSDKWFAENTIVINFITVFQTSQKCYTMIMKYIKFCSFLRKFDNVEYFLCDSVLYIKLRYVNK